MFTYLHHKKKRNSISQFHQTHWAVKSITKLSSSKHHPHHRFHNRLPKRNTLNNNKLKKRPWSTSLLRLELLFFRKQKELWDLTLKLAFALLNSQKPESLAEIQQNLAARQPQYSQPSKPEVYFIKYKVKSREMISTLMNKIVYPLEIPTI